MYRTVIIEDDPVITQLNRQYVEKDSRFTVVQTFSAAHPALFWLRNNLVDLIILDMYMPQMSGLELLRILRAEGVNADVIMVTSADSCIQVEDIPPLQSAEPPEEGDRHSEELSFDQSVEAFERKLLRRAYQKYGSSYKVAEALGISQTKASRLLRKYDIR